MTKKLFALCIAIPLALSLAACSPDAPDVSLAAQGRPIINGLPPDAPFHDAVVSLHQCDSGGCYANIFCSGTLIAPDVVLTAAHCLDVGRRRPELMPPENLAIYVGNSPTADVWPATDEVHAVVETWMHPNYDPNSITNDIAMVRLASPSAHTTVPALPASLGFTGADEGNLTLNFAGFGQDEDGNYDVKLQIDGTLSYIQSAGQIYYNQYDGGPCFGDSGGPAFVIRNGTAYVGGMTSYGDSYCSSYGVSTRADAYEQEINDFIGVQGPYCGDGTCDADEDCGSCEADCGACAPECGDGDCNGDETCDTCETDCGICPPECGDGVCEAGEDCSSCEADCGACPSYCGDGTCDADEDCDSCATDCGDCPAVCGDGVCEGGEDCDSCAADCGACPTCGAAGDYCTSSSDCCSGRCHPRHHYCK